MATIVCNDVWSTITKLARHSKRKHVAVAYIGHGANRLLPLSKGDSLVVDMSEGSVRNGSTDPTEIEKYFKKGVNIYNCTNLHAKTFVLGNSVLFASANVSQRSKNDLIEAGLMCKEVEVRQNTIGWIRSLQTEPVTPEYIKSCKKIFKPPRWKGRVRRGKGGIAPSHSRLWILSTEDIELSDEEKEYCSKKEKEAEKQIVDSSRFKPETILWDQKSRIANKIQERDLIIQIYDRKKKVVVIPPARVLQLNVPKETDKNVRHSVFINIEERRKPHLLPIKDFAQKAEQAGIHISSKSQREIRNERVKNAILGLWSYP